MAPEHPLGVHRQGRTPVRSAGPLNIGGMQSVAAALDRLGELAASPTVSKLAAAFDAAGHELALVGGPVRDAFLGRATNDLDFTTDATPDEILAIVKPIADAHWDIGRAFGTIGAKVAGETVEITTYRADAYDGASRKPEVVFGSSLEDDLARRDFTVNALALRLPQLALVDPSGGVEDLIAKTLRTPAAPEQSFGDDPLRMLRAARFSAQLGFEVEEGTRDAMSTLAPEIDRISAERVRDELSKLLLTSSPRGGIRLLVDSGLADRVLPEIPALRLEVDEHHHHKDVYEHSLTVLDQAIDYEVARGNLDSPDLVMRLAALLHDIGKPATRKLEPGGLVSFHHHDMVGAKLARRRLRALRFDNDDERPDRCDLALVVSSGPLAGGVPRRLAARRYRCRGNLGRLRDSGFACLCGACRVAAASGHLWLYARRPGLCPARLLAPARDRADFRHFAHDRWYRGSDGGR